VNLKELKEILQLLDEKEITEFELEEEGMKLRVRKASPLAATPAPALALVPVPQPLPVAAAAQPAAAPAAATTAAPTPPAPEPDPGLVVVKSPIVGTFYRTPDPNSPPFVSVGDKVRPGQVMCIIEAMKLMNEINAECDGEVVKVYVENGQAVQYGERLFAVKPA
jgi:acetyl-CoA carboxylase biotin carboxyl carrier protein